MLSEATIITAETRAAERLAALPRQVSPLPPPPAPTFMVHERGYPDQQRLLVLRRVQERAGLVLAASRRRRGSHVRGRAISERRRR
jgi:hypothetical protein